jgi:hypothetical protein
VDLRLRIGGRVRQDPRVMALRGSTSTTSPRFTPLLADAADQPSGIGRQVHSTLAGSTGQTLTLAAGRACAHPMDWSL